MDGRPVSTGGLPAVRSALGLMTYPPQVASVRQARHFVEAVLAGTALQPLADDAGLLVSELAANAVLHARTDFDVVVYEVGDGVRVSVRDRSPALPVLIAPSATAMSGRGLALVQTLATQWGAGAGVDAGKSVWFELVPGAADGEAHPSAVDRPADQPAGAPAGEPGTDEPSIEELLAAWSEADEALHVPSGGSAAEAPSVGPGGGGGGAAGVRVVLPALDAAELLAAKEQMDDVLRELQLVLLDERRDAASTDDELAVARRLDRAAHGFDDVRRQVRQQVGRAVAAGHGHVELLLVLPPGTAARAVEYRSAVEEAEALGLRGSLLSVVETLRRHHAVRRAYLGEVIAAAG